MEDCIEVLRQVHIAFSSGRAIMPVRLTERFHDHGVMALMPAWLDDGPRLGVKCVTSFFKNQERGLPMIASTVLLLDEGLFGPEHVSDELGELLSGTKPGRTSDDQITVYQSCGIAIQDVATANLVYDEAREAGVGIEIEL